MKYITFLILSTLTYSTMVMSQETIMNYYRNTNCAIEKIVDKDYYGCLSALIKNEPSFFFVEEINLFKNALDSLEPAKRKKFESFARKLPKVVIPSVCLITGNQFVDKGITSASDSGGEEIVTTINDHYLSSIISLDRYLSFVRTNIDDIKIVDSLYELAAINTLNIFTTISLPSRRRSSYWNDNLMLAISHNLNSLSEVNQDLLLEKLKEHVWKGNIHAQQYALWYDEVYASRNDEMTFYGVGFSAELLSTDPLIFITKAKNVNNIDEVHIRRAEMMLGKLETWYKFKNISYDFDIN